jgi:hypothetical protein
MGLQRALIGRRAVVLAVLALPTLAPGRALAAKLPLKEQPARTKPLGVWGLVDRNPSADVGGTVSAGLFFRPNIDVEQPVMRWWVPRWTGAGTTQGRTCVPMNLSNQTVLDPMVAGAYVPIQLDIPVPVPPKPINVGKGEQRSERTQEIQTGKRRRLYRVSIDLADPATCRRASWGFNITVLDAYP